MFKECAYSRSKWKLAATMVLLCAVTRINQDRNPQYILLEWRLTIQLHFVSIVTLCGGHADNGTSGSMGQKVPPKKKKSEKSSRHLSPCDINQKEQNGSGHMKTHMCNAEITKPWTQTISTPALHSYTHSAHTWYICSTCSQFNFYCVWTPLYVLCKNIKVKSYITQILFFPLKLHWAVKWRLKATHLLVRSVTLLKVFFILYLLGRTHTLLKNYLHLKFKKKDMQQKGNLKITNHI